MERKAFRIAWVLAIIATVGCDGGAAPPAVSEATSAGGEPLAEPARTARQADSQADPASSARTMANEVQSATDPPANAPPASASPEPDVTLPASAQVPAARPAPEPAAPSESTDAADILARAERAYANIHSMRADFTQQVYVPLLESTVDSQGTMYHIAPDRFLMDFSQPEGDIVLADGTYVWMYYPSNDPKQVMRGRLAEGGRQVDLQREFLSNASQRFTATRTGTESVGGRETHALTLVPRGSSSYQQIRLWVDTDDYLVRRFEITEANGSVRKLELSNLQPNAAVADSLFVFTPPPGTQVIEP